MRRRYSGDSPNTCSYLAIQSPTKIACPIDSPASAHDRGVYVAGLGSAHRDDGLDRAGRKEQRF